MSGLVTVVAGAALVGVVATGVLLVLALRRIARLERAHSALKWDLVALRAEAGARQRGTGDPAPATPGASGHDRPSGPARRPTGATAWRRAHRRTHPARRRPR
ncbi:hypothetical protein H7X46_06555 [Pseudonocardia sp. C8]|uniref:hypothetical protein n=1 Tax=Pseudonocardia sp. C8 TaxID=2762759 RepID=UPI0016435553|nr:hypothetical protein [Pseudonocardia sp. C8]MBC3190718.1 hypothetical protein [Pseudonocardia sp. C8]